MAAPGGAGGTGGATGSCSTPPAASTLVGWAAVAGMGITTTTGGGNASPQTVTTLSALTAAAGRNTPAVIYVKGVLAPGKISVGSNKTIVGLCGAEIHGHLERQRLATSSSATSRSSATAWATAALDPTTTRPSAARRATTR